MLRPVTFNYGALKSGDHALERHLYMAYQEGTVRGCNLTYTPSHIFISEGYFIQKGRMTQVIGSHEIAAPTTPAGELFCRLISTIDLSKQNTRQSINQMFFEVLYSPTAFPALRNDDLWANPTTGVDQLLWAEFRVGPQGISQFVSKIQGITIESISQALLSFVEQTKDMVEDEAAAAIRHIQTIIGEIEDESFVRQSNYMRAPAWGENPAWDGDVLSVTFTPDTLLKEGEEVRVKLPIGIAIPASPMLKLNDEIPLPILNNRGVQLISANLFPGALYAFTRIGSSFFLRDSGSAMLSNMPTGEIVITTSQTIIIPEGVEWIQALLVGAGASGANTLAGGGGGYVVVRTIRVIPGKALYISIGIGGASPSSSANYGNDGGGTQISGPALVDNIPSLLIARGGIAGRYTVYNSIFFGRGGDGGSGGAAPGYFGPNASGGTNGADGGDPSGSKMGGVGQKSSTFGYSRGGNNYPSAAPRENSGDGGHGLSPIAGAGADGLAIIKWGDNFFVV